MLENNWIRAYDNIVDEDFCDQIVNFYEDHPEHHQKVVLDGHRSFTQVNLQENEEWKYFSDKLMSAFYGAVDQYKIDCEVEENMFPEQFAFEMFRMKRYLPNGVDEFKPHVDVGDYASARRFLVFFLYLNEPEGGETAFPQHQLAVKPAKGRMLMFPPMWTHLHAGLKPIGQPKYIVGSYLHYV